MIDLLTTIKEEEKRLEENWVPNKSDDIDEEVCRENVPTEFNIYKWAKLHPERSISAAINRVQEIFDRADEVSFGFSGGKDSTLSAELCILELKRRNERIKAGINRYGENTIDPLDKKWENKKLWGINQDSEWIFTDAINHVFRFAKKHGPRIFNFNGKEYLGSDFIKTKTHGMITAQQIYDIVQNGETVEI